MKRIILLFLVSMCVTYAEDNLRASSAPYISGDTFRSYADHLFDETCQKFNPDSVQHGDVVFVKGDLLSNFILIKHPFIRNPYVLVVHNSDESINERFAELLNDEKILECFAQNIDNYSHPKLTNLPIGLANRYWLHGSIDVVNMVKSEESNIAKEHLLYLNIAVDTNQAARIPVYEMFKNRSYCYNGSPKPFKDYLRDLAACKFVLSPKGNGIDCHRTWEALYMGAIPIVKTSSLDPMYSGLPVLIVKQWSEITEELLNSVYEKLSFKQCSLEKLQAFYWYQQFTKYKLNRDNYACLPFNPTQRVPDAFSQEPIDVVIPCTDKDVKILHLCIESIWKYCKNVRKIYVVSSRSFTDRAEWFDESRFPFTKGDIAKALMKSDVDAVKYLSDDKTRVGWFLQQLLKLYAPFVIPDISLNVLVVDADVIFLKPVSFQNENGAPLFNVTEEYHLPYFGHMRRFLPGLSRVKPEYSGVAHHMLLQKPILARLFQTVEELHGKELWRSFCDKVNQEDIWLSGASEYEIYFNYVLTLYPEAKIRLLKMRNIESIQELSRSSRKNYDYVAYHSYSRTPIH